MSIFSKFFGRGNAATPKDPQAPIKSLMRNAPKIGGQIGENARMKRELLGSFKKGGTVKKTGIYKLHKGEKVVPAKKKEMAEKMKDKYTGRKGEYTKTQQGNWMKVHPLDRI